MKTLSKTSNKYSNLKIAWFPQKLESLRDNIITSPIYVRVKPTNRCNHNCFFCVYNASFSNMHDTMSRNDELSREKLLEILKDFSKIGVKAVTYSGGGEPLLHPNIVEILKTTKQYGIDLSIITNGQLLSGERAQELAEAKWVRVSIDYSSSEEFIKSKRGTEKMFYQIIDNIKDFSKIKKDSCDLSVNFIVTKENYKSIYTASKLFSELNIDNVRYSPVWTKDFLNYHNDIKEEVIEQLTKSRRDFQTDSFIIYDSYKLNEDINNRKYNKCYYMQVVPVIGADGNVYNCHNKSYTEEAIIGNINNQSFENMWFSESTKKHFESFNPQLHCQCQCANDDKNLFIHDLIKFNGDNYV